jgi:hypothetical protein
MPSKTLSESIIKNAKDPYYNLLFRLLRSYIISFIEQLIIQKVSSLQLRNSSFDITILNSRKFSHDLVCSLHSQWR